jgi:hypothetical protein
VTKEILVILAKQDPLDLKDRKDHKVRQELLVQPEPQVQQALLARQA